MPNIPISELGHLSGHGRPILILRQWSARMLDESTAAGDRHDGDSRCTETRRRVSAFGLGDGYKGAIDLKLRHDEVPGNLPCVDLRPSGFRKLPTQGLILPYVVEEGRLRIQRTTSVVRLIVGIVSRLTSPGN